MELMLNKGSGIPLYKQVKNSIIDKIRCGELHSGFKMPTERELSELLKISRNTVSAAYKDLEKDGLLISRQGKGTFVSAESEDILSDQFHDKILRFIDMGIDEAFATGIEAKDFLRLVEQRVTEKLDLKRTASAVYIECNTEQARDFSKQIESGTNMKCEPLTISDLIEMSDETSLTLYNAKVIISTFNHVPEVMEYIKDYNKTILGVAINPDLKTMVRIARYPQTTRFAFVCISLEFMDKVRTSLESSGLNDLDLVYTNTQDSAELEELIRDRDIILVSPGRYRDVNKFVEADHILPLLYNLDDGSLKTLKQRLLELNIN